MAGELDEQCKAENAMLARTGRRRHYVQKPCVQLVGPFLPCLSYGADGGNHHPLGLGRRYALVPGHLT